MWLDEAWWPTKVEAHCNNYYMVNNLNSSIKFRFNVRSEGPMVWPPNVAED